MNDKVIQVTESSMPIFDEYVEEIRELWESHWLTNMGVKHKELERKLKDYLNVQNITLYTNGHIALENAIEALNLSGEVITTPFTFASTTNAIIRKNLTPVFCDINGEDFTIDVEKIENLITEKTSAIIPVHVYGNVCNVEAIEEIAKKYDLKVIYDAAHAFGVSIDNNAIGSFGDVSMFSFHATKVFNTIEGGALTYNDDSLVDKLNTLKNFGISGPDEITFPGGNGKMNEFQAAMGLCNLKHIEQELQKRKIAYERYMSNLSNVPGIKLPKYQKGVTKNYSYFPVVFESYKYSRDKVYEKLKQNNIFSRKYFYPLTNQFMYNKHMYSFNETPIAEYVANNVLVLPLYASLQIDDVDKICKVILNEED